MIMLQPPFKGTDMQDLSRKICRGVYPALHKQYSSDLNHVIKCMLQQKGKDRPNCDQLLDMKQVLRNLPKEMIELVGQEEEKSQLIGTIKLPRGGNLRAIGDNLPKANYSRRDLSSRGSGRAGMPRNSSLPALGQAPGAMAHGGSRQNLGHPREE